MDENADLDEKKAAYQQIRKPEDMPMSEWLQSSEFKKKKAAKRAWKGARKKRKNTDPK